MALPAAMAVRARLAADGAWLASHKHCFVEPALEQPRGPDAGKSRRLPTSWDAYWKRRGWDAHAARTIGEEPLLHAPMYRQLSAILTFSTTLAHVLSRHSRFGLASRVEPGRGLNLVVLGARAEATLPPSAWLELAHALAAEHRGGITLRMVGPSVDPQLAMGGSQDAWRAEGMRVSLHRGLYHELVDANAEHAPRIGRPDAFVLFHPGLAHNGWQVGWRRTIERILDSNVPALFTGFSPADSHANRRFVAEQRSAWLRARGGGTPAEQMRLWLNPFASRRLLLDEGGSGPSAGVMQPNHSFFVLPAGSG